MEMEMQEVVAAIARQEEQIKSLADRMGNLEKLTESVHNLSISLERMTAKQAALETHVGEIATDVDELKEKPVKRWESIVAAVIAALVGAAVTYFLKK